MTQVLQLHFNFIPHEPPSPSKSRRDSFVPTGRGGSGNLRRPSTSISTNDTSSADNRLPSEFRPTSPEVPPGRHSPAEKKRFTSSGRGGSGNIQPPASDLDAHPLTASILSRHSAVQAQYEQRVRRAHAESHMVRSSGRGGSGNIADPRRRSRSHEPRTTVKRRFFTAKGRERGTEKDRTANKRTSLVTCSSGSSGALETRCSRESHCSNELTSSDPGDALPSDRAVTRHSSKKKESLLARRGRLPPPLPPPSTPIPSPERLCFESPPAIKPMYPQNYYPGSLGPGLDAHSTMSESAILEDLEEYLSFLDLDF